MVHCRPPRFLPLNQVLKQAAILQHEALASPQTLLDVSAKSFLLSDLTRSFSSSPQPPETTPLKAAGAQATLLSTRSVLRFEGPDTISFLQGLLTNDISRLASSKAPPTPVPTPTPTQPAAVHPPIYAALLSPQGRFLYDLVLYRPTSGEERLDRSGAGPGDSDEKTVLFADVDAEAKDDLLSTLKKYRLRAKVDISDASEELKTWVQFGGALSDDPSVGSEKEAGAMGYGGTEDTAGESAAQSNGGGWRWYKDPRLAQLGLRGLFKKDSQPPLVEADKDADERLYQVWRYEHGVPEGSSEIPTGEALPLEYNLDALNGVSYEKGCYVGQELTARTHHRGVVRKRIMPVVFGRGTDEISDAGVSPGSEVSDQGSGKKVGKVTAALGSRGLAHLRLESALKEGSELVVKGAGGEVQLSAIRPEWWPAEWGTEEAGA